MKIIVIFNCYFVLILDSAVHSQVVPRATTARSQAPLPIVTGYENQSQMYSSAGTENQDGASLTNEDQTVYPDDYTLQNWQKVFNLLRSNLLFNIWIYRYYYSRTTMQ